MPNDRHWGDLIGRREEWERETLLGGRTPEQLRWKSRRVVRGTEPTINPEDWFSHCLLVAAQGSGKTNVIRWRINQILPAIKEGKATLILLDPKDVLTRQLPTLVRSIGLEERTILIDPIESPVSLNLFDRGDGSRAAIHDTIARLVRLLNTITLDLQPFQRDTLSLAIQAVFAIHNNPKFDDLYPILRKGKEALPMELLPPHVQDIFEHDFRDSDGRFVVSRLNTFRNNPFFEPLVTQSAPSFDLLSEMQAGKLILIKATIKEPLYGKIWIEQIDRIVDARLDMPENERTDTFLIIDEAQIFIGDQHSEHFADILDRAREAKIGVIVACQHMNQIKNSHVRSSLYNSALKFISKTNADLFDLARSMAGDMDANRFRTVPRHNFLFCSPDAPHTELINLGPIKFPEWKWKDVRHFWHKPEPRQTYIPETPAIVTPESEPEVSPPPPKRGTTNWKPGGKI